MKTCFISLLALILVGQIKAQEIELTVLENQPYNKIDDGQVVSPAYAWAFFEELVEEFGFSVNSFSNNSLGQAGVTEGQIDLLSGDFSTDLTLRPLSGFEYGILDKNFDEQLTIQENQSVTGKSTVSYLVTVESGSNVLKLEWTNVKLNGSSQLDSINFQIWCYDSGEIEYRYGDSYLENSSSYNKFEVSIFEEGDTGINFHYSLDGNPNTPALVKSPQTETYITGLPTKGTVYRFSRKATGISNINARHKFTIGPNPSSGIFHLETDKSIQGIDALVVKDLSGKIVHKSLLLGSQRIDLSHLNNGVYLIEIQTKDGVEVIKLMKQ